MASNQRSSVPKFGNWENDDNVPYTVYFEKARKNRGEKMINPNDPEENLEAFPNKDSSSLERSSSDPPPKPKTGPSQEHRRIREDGDVRQKSINSPARPEAGNIGRARRQDGPTRQRESLERSPLHPHYQAKVGGRVGGSPSWEGKNSDGSSHGTPGRSWLKAAKGDEDLDKGAFVPRFGEWDENDPQAAENFTHIFNKVREERNAEAGNVTGTPKHGTPQLTNEPKKPGCFCW